MKWSALSAFSGRGGPLCECSLGSLLSRSSALVGGAARKESTRRCAGQRGALFSLSTGALIGRMCCSAPQRMGPTAERNTFAARDTLSSFSHLPHSSPSGAAQQTSAHSTQRMSHTECGAAKRNTPKVDQRDGKCGCTAKSARIQTPDADSLR